MYFLRQSLAHVFGVDVHPSLEVIAQYAVPYINLRR